MKPAYLKLLESGDLEGRVSESWRHMEDCDLCARYCHVNRMETIKGAVCRTDESPPLDRSITRGEFDQSIKWAMDFGFHRFG